MFQNAYLDILINQKDQTLGEISKITQDLETKIAQVYDVKSLERVISKKRKASKIPKYVLISSMFFSGNQSANCINFLNVH